MLETWVNSHLVQMADRPFLPWATHLLELVRLDRATTLHPATSRSAFNESNSTFYNGRTERCLNNLEASRTSKLHS